MFLKDFVESFSIIHSIIFNNKIFPTMNSTIGLSQKVLKYVINVKELQITVIRKKNPDVLKVQCDILKQNLIHSSPDILML